MTSGRGLFVAMVVLLACDVLGGFLAVATGVDTWGEAFGFDADFTVPLPVGLVQLVLAGLAARNVRPPVGLVAAVVLSVFCLISVLFGLFDGDLTDTASTVPWGVAWGVLLIVVTAVVGLLAATRARALRRPR
jgi:peptidoglycan/LPS O-acetylase OafA/YrhL